MNQLRKLTAVGVILTLLTLSACSKGTATKYTRIAVTSLTDVRAIFVANNIPVTSLDKAIVAGNAALSAFNANSASAIELASAFITSFQVVVNDAQIVPDPKLRTTLMVALLVGNVALHSLAELIDNEGSGLPAPVRRGAVTASAEAVIKEFRAKPQWRCRNSQTGRFEKMSFCKAHPDVTQVEQR